MRRSLRSRLLVGTLAIVATIWLAVALFAWREARHEAEELFDAHLAQTAALLAVFAGDETDEIEEHLPDHPYVRKVAFQIWEAGTYLRVHSAAASETRLSPVDHGFSDSGDWRVYSLWSKDDRHLIQVAESRQARLDVSHQIAERLLVPLAIALPLLATALILMIRANIARSLEQERRFTADAAHELRTPLAAIRTHAQVAQGAHISVEREAALAYVVEATDRATRLVTQLLTLARLDASALVKRFEPCSLRALAAETLMQRAPAAIAYNIELSLADSQDIEVRGSRTLLIVALSNLIDNAVRYSSPGTAVRVTADADAQGRAFVVVTDAGPGIVPEERIRVFDRFYRIAGSEESGSGLGLSIVAKIAELHGARLELSDGPDGRGLCVRMIFPSITR